MSLGSVRIKCALLSKLEPYGAPDPEPDDWMRKAETCRLYELAPTPRLFVCPITAILGKVPMVRPDRHYSVQHARARARVLSRRKL